MKLVCITIAAGVALGGVAIHAQRGASQPAARVFLLPFESKIVRGLPYSAEILSESVQTLADGNRIVQRTTGHVYRDNEGRIRREEERPSGGRSITISDVVGGRSYTLNEEQHTAAEGPLIATLNWGSGGAATLVLSQLNALKKVQLDLGGGLTVEGGGRGAPPTDAAGQKERKIEQLKATVAGGRGVALLNPSEEVAEERLQDRVIGGVLASGTRRTTTIPAGAIGNERPITVVSEEWYSPDLQILVQTERTDPRLGRSVYQVSNINRNEPDPSLFQVPTDYTIRGR